MTVFLLGPQSAESQTPEGNLELDENLADEEAGDGKWSEA